MHDTCRFCSTIPIAVFRLKQPVTVVALSVAKFPGITASSWPKSASSKIVHLDLLGSSAQFATNLPCRHPCSCLIFYIHTILNLSPEMYLQGTEIVREDGHSYTIIVLGLNNP